MSGIRPSSCEKYTIGNKLIIAAQFLPSETPNICEGAVAGAFQANLKVRSCFHYIYQFEAPCKRNVFLPTVLRYDQIPFQKIIEVLFITILTNLI